MKKSNAILIAAIALISGYAGGSIIGLPNGEGNALSGNIGKAKTYKKEVSEATKVLEERLANDTTYRNQAEASLQFINARAEGMLAAAKLSKDAIQNIEGLKQYGQTLSQIEEFANNAMTNSSEALAKLTLVAEGVSGSGYEEAANKAIVSFMLSDQSTAFVHQYIDAVDNYLKGKKLEDNEQLAFSRDQWLAYDVTTSYLNNNLSYINGKDILLSAEQIENNVNASGNDGAKLNLALVNINASSMKACSELNKVSAALGAFSDKAVNLKSAILQSSASSNSTLANGSLMGASAILSALSTQNVLSAESQEIIPGVVVTP